MSSGVTSASTLDASCPDDFSANETWNGPGGFLIICCRQTLAPVGLNLFVCVPGTAVAELSSALLCVPTLHPDVMASIAPIAIHIACRTKRNSRRSIRRSSTSHASWCPRCSLALTGIDRRHAVTCPPSGHRELEEDSFAGFRLHRSHHRKFRAAQIAFDVHHTIRALRVVRNLSACVPELFHGTGFFLFGPRRHPVAENFLWIVQIAWRYATCAAPRFVLPLVLHFIRNCQRILAGLQIHVRCRRNTAAQNSSHNYQGAFDSTVPFHHLRRSLPLSCLRYCALSETWNDHSELNIIPPRWLRATSPPENFSVFETGRSTTAYSPGRSADRGDIWYSPAAVFSRFTATRSSTNDE